MNQSILLCSTQPPEKIVNPYRIVEDLLDNMGKPVVWLKIQATAQVS